MKAMDKAGNALFITGTGTEVGKTVVCSLLLGFLLERGILAGYQKWVSTGGDMPQDLLFCLNKNNLSFDAEKLDQQVVFRFPTAASPHLAAEQDGRVVDPEQIVGMFQKSVQEYEMLLVEGVGGLLVPLCRDLLLADFLCRFTMPTLIVARSGLGTINHTLLTIEALRRRNLPIVGVVFSDENAEMAADDLLIQDNMRIVAEIGKIDVFGRLPRLIDYGQLQQAFRPIGKGILEKWTF